MPRTRSASEAKSAARSKPKRKFETPLQPEMPDDVRRRDQPEVPDASGFRPPEDGNVEQHPIHDSDMEDAGPEDFEEMVDAVERGGFDPTDKYEVERAAEIVRKKIEGSD